MHSFLLQITEDGSHTLFVPEMDEHYHSTHGAIQESNHVFLNAGLLASPLQDWDVFEVGFGTGLNALLTGLMATKQKRHCHYTSIELYPLPEDAVSHLNYSQILVDDSDLFRKLHAAPWNEEIRINEYFSLHKIQADFTHPELPENQFSIIYFDAFAPTKQEEMWQPELFTALYHSLKEEGILVTYSAKGSVRRMMQQAGFRVERLQGPPGKHEMLRGRKSAENV
ncbi:tRNA (5-methylaminomethyl-2-thiouridine)(34)-methyltransferase MnmD [Microbacter margulisiae]|uniref:tRNA U34 5-methylaminomethyl-2-thiouridine-forming methyltransferase MnmC n=1 Tax=Microbacter margulisiae TaxID=1350067 RepID=A0A7W5DRJ3_9PORP|nr:tRNA (5-methylaminomethyl-2-thiouridine)(34)-methyltransferase MnmD [Microbacter margulisiae]MBB3187784.1 tRNA U34 5-methylaminomethyl-2-thiouridine-forming methyltransferase MnmC [Microbacter margulisiae]